MNREYKRENLARAKEEGKHFFQLETDCRHLSDEQTGNNSFNITITGTYTNDQRNAILIAERLITRGLLTFEELQERDEAWRAANNKYD